MTSCGSVHPTHAQTWGQPCPDPLYSGPPTAPQSGHSPGGKETAAGLHWTGGPARGQDALHPPGLPGLRGLNRAVDWSQLPHGPTPTTLPHSLGHGTPWQPLVSRPLPLQPLPPIWGTGELQSRIRVMLPGPQVTEQEDHGDQWLQPPSCRTGTGETQGISSGPPGPKFEHRPGWGEGAQLEPLDRAVCLPKRAAGSRPPQPKGPGPGDTNPPAQGRPAA